MSNSDIVECKADAAIHIQYLHAVATIKGNILPVAIQGQIGSNSEGLTKLDIAATAEGDRVATTSAADSALQLAVAATVGNGGTGEWLGVDGLAGQQIARQQAQTQQQTERDESHPG